MLSRQTAVAYGDRAFVCVKVRLRIWKIKHTKRLAFLTWPRRTWVVSRCVQLKYTSTWRQTKVPNRVRLESLSALSDIAGPISQAST